MAFEEELNRFWADLIGPDEQLRQSIVAPLSRIEPEWRSVAVSADGTVAIWHVDGTYKTMDPPTPATSQPSSTSPGV
jgi:uncharacterized lipoprotein YmbA